MKPLELRFRNDPACPRFEEPIFPVGEDTRLGAVGRSIVLLFKLRLAGSGTRFEAAAIGFFLKVIYALFNRDSCPCWT
jgi:hypothetical protein